MEIGKVDVAAKPAYCIFKTASYSLYWNYVLLLGPCFDCNDLQISPANYTYGHIQLNGAKHKDAATFGAVMSPFDMRTLKMIKAGCCPPGLVNEILGGGPG